MNVYDQARMLAKSIAESEEYKMMVNAKKPIDSNPTLKKMLDDYRTKQLEVQGLQLAGKKVPEDKMQAFRGIYDLAVNNNQMKSFLDAELRFAVMMSDIQKILGEEIKL